MSMVGYCVLELDTFEVIYYGTDEAAAAAAAVEGTYWATAPTICAAIVSAINDAGQTRCGDKLARVTVPYSDFAAAAIEDSCAQRGCFLR
jgi:hypothetical protein